MSIPVFLCGLNPYSQPYGIFPTPIKSGQSILRFTKSVSPKEIIGQFTHFSSMISQMYVFNRVFTNWLPFTSLAAILYTLIFFRLNNSPGIFLTAGLLLYLPTIIIGLKIALKDSSIDLITFFKRPANIATLSRAVLILAGLGLALYSKKYGIRVCAIISAVFITTGFAADFFDGWLARHEAEKPLSAKWGGWFDAESDALIILLSCICLFPITEMPVILIIPAIARYVFGPVYLLFPVPLETPPWYFWYSKNSAAVFQFLLGFIWAAALLIPGGQIYQYFFVLQTRILIPVVSYLIIISFIVEGYFRIRTIANLVPRGYRKGILTSYFIYYTIPFRRFRMKNFYKEFVAAGSIAFDVGAHLGNRTRTFLDLGARATAFEPQPVCAALLTSWFGNNQSVSLNFCSLGDRDTNAELLISHENPTLTSVDSGWVSEIGKKDAFEKVRWQEKLVIKMISLDTAIEIYGLPQFIKIDTEGFEHHVLQGLSTAVKNISFEFLPDQPQRAVKCLEEINRLGHYSFNFSRGESMKLYFREWRSNEEIVKFISLYPETARSGDIYAKLQ